MSNQNTPVTAQGLPSIRRATRMFIWAGLSSLLCLWPGHLSTQASASERNVAQSLPESSPLELGKPIERELSGGISHFYNIRMTSGQFLRVTVEQQGIDVTVVLSTPDGKKISVANSEQASERSETVTAISESTGAYLVEVRSTEKTAKPGRYEIKLEDLRIATAEDRHQVAGDALYREAERLGNGTLEARKKKHR